VIELKILLLILISFFLLPYVFGALVNVSVTTFSDVTWIKENASQTQKASDAASSENIEIDQTVAELFQENLTRTIQGGHQMLQLSSSSGSASFSRHIMSKDYKVILKEGVLRYDPTDPTTIFRPSDTKAVVVTTVAINSKIEFRWHYRSNSSNTWVSAYNWSSNVYSFREYDFAAWLLIDGYWPAYNFPRAYKVDVYLDSSPSPSFSEFFEVTNGGLNSPRIGGGIDANGYPVNMKSRFTIGVDTEAYHYLRFDKIAYFNEELGSSHNFTTVWVQPNGSTYKTYQGNFSDYKDANVTWNYWEYRNAPDDYISINASTPVGNWKVEVYLDRYFNTTWMRYGPVATTRFIVGNTSVADWTFMVYLDADNDLETPGIDIFLYMARIGSTSRVNIVVQMDRIPSYDERYGGWIDTKRFYVTKGMWPTAGNATLDWPDREVDMGDPNTLKDFVNWTIDYYPANYYTLVLWDHGTGVVGLSYDLTSNDFLTLSELGEALSGLPVTIDIVFSDACAMNMAEIAYQIKDYANLLVGPEGLGWSPAHYDYYLSRLISNPSMLPRAFAEGIVTDYMYWSKNSEDAYQIPNATMSAMDLTKITSFIAAIDDFALKLKDKETPYLSLLYPSHEKIILARNLTLGFPGPYGDQFGYYIDLYHFANLTYQSVPDEELRNAANQVMSVLSFGNVIIKEGNKNLPDSHGLAISFPNEKGKYDSIMYGTTTFANVYGNTSFAKDTLWDEFVEYHLTGYILTIKTPYPDISLKIDQDSYTTDAGGRIRVFVLPKSYTINVTTPVSTGPGSRGVFKQWNDYQTNSSRIITVTCSTTYTAYYTTQYKVTFSQYGIGADFTQNLVTIDGYNASSLPVFFWWNESTTYTFAFQSPLIVTPSAKRYVWNSTSGLSTLQSDPITVSRPGSVTANYVTQYYLTVTSLYGSLTPTSGWFEAGESVYASVISPVLGQTGTRYVCTGWTGTGSVNTYGTTTAVTFTINAPSSITWNWKTQYLLTVHTDPTGISPQPNISPPGPWYDNGTLVNCTAQEISGRVFDHWTGDGTSWDSSINPITITMDGPYEATAHYVRALAWWETLFRPETLQVILGLLGTGLTVALVGTAWIRTRRGRSVVKNFLNEIDDVYSRFKTNPRKCEEELYRLRNTVLEGVTDGKITQESYEIVDKRIDKYLEELRKQ